MQFTGPESSPFSDEAHVRAISAALWTRRERGAAAVMVGAGFSANSVPLGTDAIPLWAGLVTEMQVQLRDGEPRDNPAGGGVNSLRLAEEYQAAFGRPALDRLISEKISDTRFEPGHLHRRLLELPWADVFTTNWDTLLERSARQVLDRSYDVVRTTAEIPRSASPRIIKLHGSLPSNTPFILTEEDFRTYPTKFAPFVNLAQQSMMENVFCLLGFSGDDPNFLYWSGWVRDHLGPSAPRIYLVGWLALTQARRKMLEDRNVIPVDLSKLRPAVAWPDSMRHSLALKWFLRSLRSAEPSRAVIWPDSKPQPTWPTILPPPAGISAAVQRAAPTETDVIKIAQSWHAERLRYPGWLIAPESLRTTTWLYTRQHLGAAIRGTHALDPVSQLFAASELNWRFEVSLTPLPPELRAIFESVLNIAEPLSTSSNERERLPRPWDPATAWLELALACLRNSREQGDVAGMQTWVARLASRTIHDEAAESFVNYELCLGALERLDYPVLKTLLSQWTRIAPDPIWSVRKAAILAELGELAAARTVSASALIEVRRRTRKDVDDLTFLSREGWALELLQSLRWASLPVPAPEHEEEPDFWDRMFRLSKLECSPQQRMNEVNHALAKGPARLSGRQERQAFDSGTTVVTTSLGPADAWSAALPALWARRLLEDGGVPSSAGNHMLGKDLLMKAAAYLSKVMPQTAMAIALRCSGSADDRALDELFSRISVARTGEAEASMLIERLQGSMELAASRLRSGLTLRDAETEHATRQFVAAVRLMSRFCLRVPAKAGSVFTIAAGYCQDGNLRAQPRVSEEIMRLVNRSVEAMSTAEQNAHALRIFSLPLPEGDYLSPAPEPCTQLTPTFPPARAGTEHEWAVAVRTLIAATSARGMKRIAALRRLDIMCQLGLLAPGEEKALAETMWASTPFEFRNAQNWGLPPSIFLHLPQMRPGQAVEAFREAMLVDTGSLYTGFTAMRYFTTLRSAGRTEKRGAEPKILLTTEEIQLVLNRVETWLESLSGRTREVTANPFEDRDDSETPIVNALLDAVLPRLEPCSAAANRAVALIARMTAEGRRTEVLSHWVVHLNSSELEDAVDNLLVAANSADQSRASLALIGIRLWAVKAAEGLVGPLPKSLSEQVVISVASLRLVPLAAALDSAAVLVENGLVPDGSRSEARLLAALEALLALATYDHPLEEADPLVSTGDVRAGSVRLAIAMKTRRGATTVLDEWISIAPLDPLPEVRAVADRARMEVTKAASAA